MNNILFRIVVVLGGTVAFVVLFLLGPQILHLLARFFPETTTPEDMSWRVAVTITLVVVSLVAYGIIGWIVGRMKPSGGWIWGLWIAIVPVLAGVGIIFAFDAIYPLTALANVTAVVAGAVAGAHLGSISGGISLTK